MQSKLWKRFSRNRLALIGLLLVLFFAALAIFAPLIAPVPANSQWILGIPAQIPRLGFAAQPSPPSAAHLLGTTQGQYDILFGIVWGARSAFLVGFLVVVFSIIVGITVGSLAAYYRGWLDSVLMRFTDMVLALPALVLAMVLVTVLGQSLVNVMIAVAAVWWPSYARVLRGEVLKVRNLEYVDAAQAVGGRDLRIIFKHILPNVIVPMLVLASLDIGSIVILAAALSFLGIGAPVGFPDWGQLISFARNWMIGPPDAPFKFWYVSFFPGLAIFLFVLGWNLLGDAIRDALDVRSV